MKSEGNSQSRRNRWSESRIKKFKFFALILLLIAVAFVHPYLIGQFSYLLGGLPVWVWIQLLVVAVLGLIVWKANELLLGDDDREEQIKP